MNPAKSKRDCRKKARFLNEQRARITGWGKIQADTPGKHLWPYRCEHCDGWHLTSSWQKAVPPISRISSGIFPK